MKKLLSLGSATIVLSLLFATAASASVATAPGQNKIKCFDGITDGGYGGVCTILSNAAKKGSAKLDNTDGNAHGSYSGVYIANSNTGVTKVGDMTSLSFNYTGTATAGSPRFSLPVDTNGDGLTDGYLFISAFYCNDGAGLVDAIHDSTCTIYTNFSSESFANWAALVAAHPTWAISTDLSFIIADDAGMWTVSNVYLGQAVK